MSGLPIQQPEVLKALKFLHAANNQKVYPTMVEVVKFATEKEPESQFAFRAVEFDAFRSVSTDHLLKYLEDARLVTVVRGGAHLSDAGHALVKENQKRAFEDPEEVLEVVGRARDPIFYAKLLTEIGKLEDALLVDPYLPASDLYSVLELRNVTRVLTNKGRGTRPIAGEQPQNRKEAMALALGAFEVRPELRMQNPEGRELHDRVVLPRSGQGIMLGTSLGGTQLTVVTHLTEDATEVLLRHYEQIFDSAFPVNPIIRDAAPESGD